MHEHFFILVAMVFINRTLQYIVILPGNIGIKKSNSITTLQTIHADFVVSFKLVFNILANTVPMCNIIDFISKDGNRTFALWITSNPEKYISLTNDSLNFWIGFDLWGEQSIKISHLHVGNLHYNTSISINGKTVESIIDSASRMFEDVNVYASNPWNNSVTGTIGSINISSKGKDLGVLVRDIYLNIAYSSDTYFYLERSPKYPQYPDGYHFINEFNAPQNFDDYYCQRVRGWFQVIYDGSYTFYISCDNFCDLYLSEGIDPGNKTNIIHQKTWVDYLHWDRSDQKSAEIILKANNKYYIEALMCEGNIRDSLSVAFKQNNESLSSLKPMSADWFSQMRIDEYPYDSLDIMENEICISENGTYRICTCKNGYEYENQGLSCVVNEIEICKPALNVSFGGSWKNNLLILSIQLSHLYEPDKVAKNITWEYFLPPFASLHTEDGINGFVKVASYAPKYTLQISKNFPTESFNHTISVTLNVVNCEIDGSFLVDIPMKWSYQNSENLIWSQTKTYREKILCPIRKLSKLQINENSLAESFGRSIYWDQNSSDIYICMSQHVISSKKAACYHSNNDGQLWTGLDVRIGSVVGHTSTRNLYAVHRSRKSYLMFDNNYKKWLALANNDFVKILNKIDFNSLKNLEEDHDQVYNLGNKEWMGNSVGLFFRNVSGDPWIQRVQWNI